MQLVEDIWDSMAKETSSQLRPFPEDCSELNRRLVAHQVNPNSSVPWEQVRASLFSD